MCMCLQHYATAGLNTCLVIHGQDTTAEYLLNCKIGNSHVKCNNNLSAVRLETTKVCLLLLFLILPICHFVNFLVLVTLDLAIALFVQMLLEPLAHLKQADAQLNMTQGVLGGVGM